MNKSPESTLMKRLTLLSLIFLMALTINAQDEKAPIQSVLPAEVIKANPQLYDYKTIGEARLALKKMLDEGGENFNFTPDIQDLFKGE